MPYGMWLLITGEKILFNRQYLPIYVEIKRYDNVIDELFFYDDGNQPWDNIKDFKIYKQKLEDAGILPILQIPMETKS